MYFSTGMDIFQEDWCQLYYWVYAAIGPRLTKVCCSMEFQNIDMKEASVKIFIWQDRKWFFHSCVQSENWVSKLICINSLTSASSSLSFQLHSGFRAHHLRKYVYACLNLIDKIGTRLCLWVDIHLDGYIRFRLGMSVPLKQKLVLPWKCNSHYYLKEVKV